MGSCCPILAVIGENSPIVTAMGSYCPILTVTGDNSLIQQWEVVVLYLL